MKYFKTILLTITFSFLFNGCGIIAALAMTPNTDKMNDYNISSSNQAILKPLAKKNYKVNIKKFVRNTEENITIKCRYTTSVQPSKDETYTSYIEHAFKKELTTSKLYDSTAEISIYAKINEINGNSTYGNAYWEFDITLISSNNETYHITSTYEYPSSISATYACKEMHKTFPLALQKLIHDAIKDPNFERLLQKSKK